MTKLLTSVGALAFVAIAVAYPAHAVPKGNGWGQCMHMCTLSGRLTQSCLRSCGTVTTKRAATERRCGGTGPTCPTNPTGPTHPITVLRKH